MDNPYQYLSNAFRPEFEVRFVVERAEGCMLLLLSQGEQLRVRRTLTGEQLADPEKLSQVVESIRFGLAIDRGDGLRGLHALGVAAGGSSA